MGSNRGPGEALLTAAQQRLGDILSNARIAPIYRSEAVSDTPQADYLNTVVVGHSSLPSEALLAIAKQLELGAGRSRADRRNQPRPLDVDLLFAGDELSNRPELTLPHPRLSARIFVLQPLADIAPTWQVPADGRTAQALLDDLIAHGSPIAIQRLGSPDLAESNSAGSDPAE